jgi:hypothetical protein
MDITEAIKEIVSSLSAISKRLERLETREIDNNIAPADLSYVTVNDESATLAQVRQLVAGAGIALTDNGAGNTIEVAATGGGGYTEGASVYNNANQNSTSGVWLEVLFNSENYDTDGIHSTLANTGRLTCQTAGKYIVTACINWAANNNGLRVIGINLTNDSIADAAVSEQRFNATTGDDTWASTSCIIDMDVGDFVTVHVYQNSGSTLAIKYSAASPGSPTLAMQRIG